MDVLVVDYDLLNSFVKDTASRIKHHFFSCNTFEKAHTRTLKCHPVPRGGVPVALALAGVLPIMLVDNPIEADFIIDDLIESGATAARIKCAAAEMRADDIPFFALIDKRTWAHGNSWVQWPWEKAADDTDESATDNVRRMLQYIGEDPTREGLLETPARVLKALREKCSGYAIANPGELLKTFEDGAADGVVVVRDIHFDSMCEHHMERISGVVGIAYIPNGRIVGLSKFVRVVDAYAHRLQVQERLTGQIADCINDALTPHGVAVRVDATHGCIECRGVRRHGVTTITNELRGVFKTDPAARAEVMALLG